MNIPVISLPIAPKPVAATELPHNTPRQGQYPKQWLRLLSSGLLLAVGSFICLAGLATLAIGLWLGIAALLTVGYKLLYVLAGIIAIITGFIVVVTGFHTYMHRERLRNRL